MDRRLEHIEQIEAQLQMMKEEFIIKRGWHWSMNGSLSVALWQKSFDDTVIELTLQAAFEMEVAISD